MNRTDQHKAARNEADQNGTAKKRPDKHLLDTIYIDGIGVFGPGMADWTQACAVLNGHTPFDLGAELPLFHVADLPATERRRAGRSIKLAVDLAAQAVRSAQIDPALPANVFASTSGDTHVLTDICAALATDDRLISPMRFHNSVHNAATGYWTIAQQNRQPTTAVALHNLTASAGLLEAATEVITEQTPVLLVIYDIPFPPPLDAAEPIAAAFGASFLLQPQQTEYSVAAMRLHLSPVEQHAVDVLNEPALESLRMGVAAARILPFLSILARSTPAQSISAQPEAIHTVTLDYVTPRVLKIDIQPCSNTKENR